MLIRIIKQLAPLSLLAALLYAPPELLERYLGAGLARTTWPTVVRPVLQALVGLGVARRLNAALSALSTNNWRVSSRPPRGGAWDWPREIAVVTGGCGGLGLALVEGLTARGVRVAVLDVADEAPPALRANPRASFFRCDVSSAAAVARAADDVRAVLGGDPSVLVNAAGLARRHAVLDAAEADLRAVLGANLLALWFTAQQFVPAMVRAGRGHVVTVASLASFVALPGAVEYSATKAGALAFHEGLACELKHVHRAPGVVTTVVHPGFVRTPMTEPFADRIGTMLEVEDVVGPLLEHIFAGRGGQLVVPGRLTFLSTLRGWPHWLQEGLRDVLGRGAGRS